MTNRVINYAAFAILTLLWLGFIAALIFNRDILDNVWQSFLGWPLILKLVVGLFTLPVVLGLWIWGTTWPLWLRLILVIGLAWVTVYVFFPRRPRSQPEISPGKS